MLDKDMLIHNPGNTHEITELFAALSIDKAGNEGICAIKIDDVYYPIIFSTREKIDRLENSLSELKHYSADKKIRIVRFSNKEVLDVIT